jgi:hypothetical protein
MHSPRCGWLRRLARGATGCLLGGAMMVPLGPTTTQQAVNQMNSTSMRPMPSVGTAPVTGGTQVWVPSRRISIPGEPSSVTVPGHWERRLPTGDVHVPPLVVSPPSGGTITLPAATRPPVEQRFNSP